MAKYIFSEKDNEILIELIRELYELKGTSKRKKDNMFYDIINFISGKKAEATNISYYYDDFEF